MLACVPANMPQARSDKTKARKPNQRSPAKRSKKRYPTLARVMIENSSVPSQIAMIRPSDTRKHRSAAQISSPCEPSNMDTMRRSPSSSRAELSSLPPPYSPSSLLSGTISPPLKSARHHYSCNSLHASRNTSNGGLAIPLPSTMIPIDAKSSKVTSALVPSETHRISTDHKPQHRRPDTFYSIASARTGSTKLGEIPMHKWAEPWDYKAAEKANEEAIANGWPVSGDTGTAKQKKGGWKRWLGKKSELA